MSKKTRPQGGLPRFVFNILYLAGFGFLMVGIGGTSAGTKFLFSGRSVWGSLVSLVGGVLIAMGGIFFMRRFKTDEIDDSVL